MNLLTGEAEPGLPYWWESIKWAEKDFLFPSKVDLLVIGGGYTGLSAAIAGHDAGASVAVIDAGKPGQGASTRNGGMVGSHPRLSWKAVSSRFGAATADALFAEAAVALNWFRKLVAREAIDCDLQQTGRIQLAYTDGHFSAQEELASDVSSRSAVRCQIVSRSDLEKHIVTPLYRGGLLFPEHCGFHPAKFHSGLLSAALRRGITVLEGTPGLSVTREKGGFRVETPRGVIRTDKVVLATSGYLQGRFGWFAARVFPVPSYMIATEPVSSELLGELAPGRRMMVETRAAHSYFRISPDGSRVLFGGRAALLPIDLELAASRLRSVMIGIWPRLADVGISHVWMGNTGFSFGHLPHVGEKDGVHYAMGYSGSGTVLAPFLGASAALRALGVDGGQTAYGNTPLMSRWFYRGGSAYFLRLADIWYRRWVDVREDWIARREEKQR